MQWTIGVIPAILALSLASCAPQPAARIPLKPVPAQPADLPLEETGPETDFAGIPNDEMSGS